MQVQMKIKGLMVDPVTNMPIVILKDDSDDRVLPIWVGIFEANAIALKVEQIDTPRPMTHDLLQSMIGTFGAAVEKIVVNDLRDNTYFALIHVRVAGQEHLVDSRPSDALALALRVGAPIFVEESVLDRAKTIEGDRDLSDSERLKKWFENLDPDDFSKYEM